MESQKEGNKDKKEERVRKKKKRKKALHVEEASESQIYDFRLPPVWASLRIYEILLGILFFCNLLAFITKQAADFLTALRFIPLPGTRLRICSFCFYPFFIRGQIHIYFIDRFFSRQFFFSLN